MFPTGVDKTSVAIRGGGLWEPVGAAPGGGRSVARSVACARASGTGNKVVPKPTRCNGWALRFTLSTQHLRSPVPRLQVHLDEFGFGRPRLRTDVVLPAHQRRQ